MGHLSMCEDYIAEIQRRQEWIEFLQSNPSWRETPVITGSRPIDERDWQNADQLIAIERVKIATLQQYAALYA